MATARGLVPWDRASLTSRSRRVHSCLSQGKPRAEKPCPREPSGPLGLGIQTPFALRGVSLARGDGLYSCTWAPVSDMLMSQPQVGPVCWVLGWGSACIPPSRSRSLEQKPRGTVHGPPAVSRGSTLMSHSREDTTGSAAWAWCPHMKPDLCGENVPVLLSVSGAGSLGSGHSRLVRPVLLLWCWQGLLRPTASLVVETPGLLSVLTGPDSSSVPL